MSHYKEEQQRVNVVIGKVDEELNELDSRVGSVKSEIVNIRKNFLEDVKVNANKLPHKDEAEKIAMDVMEKVDRQYAKGLTLLRIEKQTRHYVDGGQTVEFPVLWIKMMHNNGSFNWVTIGGDGQIIEFEREVRWDYMMSRRQTEMWYYDDWVLARIGEGPQLLPPAALA